MKLSRKFVNDYIDLDANLSIKQIADAMTNVGNEYDNATPLINATNLVVGKIIKCTNHPDSNHLHICLVDIKDEVLNIVCGAPNAKEGIKVIVAKNGAKLPNIEIKKTTIRGVESNGMLCSLQELGLDNKYLDEKDKNGIYEFSDDVEIGMDAIKALGLDDEVIDFELTSNRADLLSILGMAYELGTIYKKQIKNIDLTYKENDEDINNSFNIEVKTEDCPLFLAKKVVNLTIKPSPDFIKNRLIASGIRPINNVVDISNYVMLETGQPLHFYDANNLGNKIIVRNAIDGEKVVTLDKVERTLTKEDIVIATDKEAIGLAGVMGGYSTEVEPTTKNIIIESAIFNSVKIRKTSKKILRSEASNRFEKGIDPKRTYMALERSAHLLEKYADATIVGGSCVYDKTTKEDKIITLQIDKVEKVLGIKIPKDTCIEILTNLGFKVESNNNILTVSVPTRRLDINIKEDLIEEIGRFYGMNNIKGKLPTFDTKLGKFNKVKRDIRNKMISLGLNETLSYSLISEEDVYKYTNDKFEKIKIADPMSEERTTLRYSLISSLKEIYEYNKNRSFNDISIFEIGKSFYKENNEYKEQTKLALLMSGVYLESLNKLKVDFYIIKGIVEELLDYLGYKNRYNFTTNNIPKELHPNTSATITIDNKEIGIIGKINPTITKDDIYVSEINLDKLLAIKTSKMSFKELNKYPSIIKDLAFIVNKDIEAQDIVKEIKKSGSSKLQNIEIFDVYTGNNIDKNKKSLAFKLTFTDNSKTLTEEEINISINKIINDISKKFNAILRGDDL